MNNYYIVFNLYLNCYFSIPFPFYGQNVIEKFKSLDSSFFTCNFIYFIFGCARSFLLHGLFSSCGERGLLCNCSVQASHSSRFSCCGAWTLGCMGFSSCRVWAQQLRLSDSGARAQQLWHAGFIALQKGGSTWIRDQTCVSCIGRRILYH